MLTILEVTDKQLLESKFTFSHPTTEPEWSEVKVTEGVQLLDSMDQVQSMAEHWLFYLKEELTDSYHSTGLRICRHFLNEWNEPVTARKITNRVKLPWQNSGFQVKFKLGENPYICRYELDSLLSLEDFSDEISGDVDSHYYYFLYQTW